MGYARKFGNGQSPQQKTHKNTALGERDVRNGWE